MSTAQQQAIRATLTGSALDLSLGLLKIGAGQLSGSYALISDGIHSLSDLVTDIFVVLMARLSHEAPDAEHPYGHRRFETLGTIVIGLALLGVAGFICLDSIRRLGMPEELRVPGGLALGVTLLSIVGKEGIYRYLKRVALRLKSSMLLASAWHSRSDAFSSVAVLVGLIGAQFGYPWMDLLAALVVGIMIGRIAWNLLRDSLRELVDTGLPAQELAAIRQHLLGHAGVDGVHELRSRRSGGQAFLDVHVQVDRHLSVSEGHYLGDRLVRSLKREFPEVADVMVHIDPEPDTEGRLEERGELPLRREVLAALAERWRTVLPPERIERVTLHYLEERIQVDIFTQDLVVDAELKARLLAAAADLPWLGGLRIHATF